MQYRNIVTAEKNYAMLLIYFEDLNEAMVFTDILERWDCDWLEAEVKQEGYARCIMINIRALCYKLYSFIMELEKHTKIDAIREKRYEKGHYSKEPPIESGIVSTKIFKSVKHFCTYKYYFDSEKDYKALIEGYEKIISLLKKNAVESDGAEKVLRNINATYDESGKYSPHPCSIAFGPNVARMVVEIVVLIGILEKQPFGPMEYLFDANR